MTVNIISIDECDKGEYSTQCKNCNGKECQDCNTMDFLKNGKCLNCDRTISKRVLFFSFMFNISNNNWIVLLENTTFFWSK